jgi:hypothetical protein
MEEDETTGIELVVEDGTFVFNPSNSDTVDDDEN